MVDKGVVKDFKKVLKVENAKDVQRFWTRFQLSLQQKRLTEKLQTLCWEFSSYRSIIQIIELKKTVEKLEELKKRDKISQT